MPYEWCWCHARRARAVFCAFGSHVNQGRGADQMPAVIRVEQCRFTQEDAPMKPLIHEVVDTPSLYPESGGRDTAAHALYPESGGRDTAAHVLYPESGGRDTAVHVLYPESGGRDTAAHALYPESGGRDTAVHALYPESGGRDTAAHADPGCQTSKIRVDDASFRSLLQNLGQILEASHRTEVRP